MSVCFSLHHAKTYKLFKRTCSSFLTEYKDSSINKMRLDSTIDSPNCKGCFYVKETVKRKCSRNFFRRNKTVHTPSNGGKLIELVLLSMNKACLFRFVLVS